MFLFVVVAFGLFLFYFKEWYERNVNKRPPGPWPIPFLGCVLQLGAAAPAPHLAFMEFEKKYGEIFRLTIGPYKEIVVPSSYQAVKEIFSNDAALGRDINDGGIYDRNLGRNLGLALSEGPHWEVIRSFTVSKLREYGFAKSSKIDRIAKEAVYSLLSTLESLEDEHGTITTDIKLLKLECHLLGIFWRMLVGELIGKEEEEMMAKLTEKSERFIESGVFGAGLLNVLPQLKYIMPDFTGYNIQMDFFSFGRNTAKDLLRERIREIRESSSHHDSEGLMDAYASKIIKGDQPQVFSEDDWSIVFLDFIQASTDTTGSFLTSLLLFMILNPDVQQKVYEELRKTVPEGEEIFYAHFIKMTYLQAVYVEVHRFTKVLQHLVPRKALRDFQYKKYTIKKGTTIMANVCSAYADPKVFADPDTFKPERFLDSNGKLVNDEKVLPFGAGKRICPGSFFADNSSFLLFTGMLSKYELSCVPGQERPRRDMNVSLTSRPYPFKIMFKKRH